jgi:16S rRNA (guanine527-N7)-methyltransferase
MNLNRFIEELKLLGIEVNDIQLNQLEKYYELLVEYNKVMNLTGITEKEEVYLKHFYDSLTIVKAIDLNTVESLCDVGTGAGFPGMVLKILFPKLKITLIDSLNKRINFLQTVINEIGLKNIDAINYRIEEYAIVNREVFDVVTARAVANISMLLEYSIPMVKVGGYFIPMKAKMDNEPDFSNATKILNCKLENFVEFKLPIEESTRTILKFYKEKSTNKKYPRKYAEMKKRPL